MLAAPRVAPGATGDGTPTPRPSSPGATFSTLNNQATVTVPTSARKSGVWPGLRPGAGSPSGPAGRTVRPVVDDLETWPTGRLLSAAARLVEHEWNAHLASWDLSHAGLAVLHVLREGAMTQRELATRVQVEDQTLSRTVERLERSAYVERRRDAADRRRRLVSLTDPGRRVLAGASDLATAEGLLSEAVDDMPALRRELLALVRHHSSHRWPAAGDRPASVG